MSVQNTVIPKTINELFIVIVLESCLSRKRDIPFPVTDKCLMKTSNLFPDVNVLKEIDQWLWTSDVVVSDKMLRYNFLKLFENTYLRLSNTLIIKRFSNIQPRLADFKVVTTFSYFDTRLQNASCRLFIV